MALHQFFKDRHCSIGIWNLEEDETFFFDNLELSEFEMNEIRELSTRKKLEWLASRYLLHITLNKEDRYSCLKDEHGKPFLVGSELFVSLTHSKDFVATVYADMPCGIDLQYHIDKIGMIAKKFVAERENNFIKKGEEIHYLHALWGVKESVYKAYGKKGVSLLNDILCEPFILNTGERSEISVTLRKNGINKKYECTHEIMDGYTLVWAREV